nr:hypothetical protein [Rhodococcus qingshengii]
MDRIVTVARYADGADSAAFASLIAGRSVGRVRRLVMCWREFVAAMWGFGRSPFERQKRVRSLLFLLVIVGWVPGLVALGLTWQAAVQLGGVAVLSFAAVLLVSWPVASVFSPGFCLESSDSSASLRVVPRDEVPGVFEVRSFSRWPMTEATASSADEVAGVVGGLADEFGVTLVALAASDSLRRSYIRKFGFVGAPEDLCRMLTRKRVKPFLVRTPRIAGERSEATG